MPLDPQIQALLHQMAAANFPVAHTQTPEEYRQFVRVWSTPEPLTRVAHVENRTVPRPDEDIPARIYTPEGSGPFPVLVFFHGGGWVVGDLETTDEFCRQLTNGAGCMVVSVAYRLAPEHPFPAGIEDGYAATTWVAQNAAQFAGDPARIAVGGDSAGGNLAAVVAHMARDRGGPPLVFQLLIYPATDLGMNTPSMEENAEGYFLTRQDIAWYTSHYLNSEEERQHPLASPLLAQNFSRLPSALIITAEYDPLRDEGERYGERLKEAGVPVTISRYQGMIHGFVGLAAVLDQGKQGLVECCAALRAAFYSQAATTAE